MVRDLVVEDEANIRSFVVINLRRSGYEPIEADCGEMALEQLRRRAAGFTQRFQHFRRGNGAQLRQRNLDGLQPVQLGLFHFHVVGERRPAGVVHKAVFPANGGQALIGVVLPQAQAVLAAAGHHAVGVHHALGY